ncbi:MAG: CPBP family intramembrane metalloprotease [Gammaproteobacteria bacterium]|nr:CPBP family intramembrane metalloprotease [Gemmatimonadota bacterium]NIR84731.1 CPBP family intramembrane metalloprotease [Gammaproteobacteria bacterium]NIU05772.1 CPBP family intramembrane metalloprotease [Gammaproteobacteria bacterium]NIX87045.1 CPBP family intramembrane metalloprotease [Gammaproteobacteria bacterium]
MTQWLGHRPELGPYLTAAAVTAAALPLYPGRRYVLVLLLLFAPLLDRSWRPPAMPRGRAHTVAWALLVALSAGLVAREPALSGGLAAGALAFIALPEEWFFRGYLLHRLGGGWRANVLVSVLFAAVHVPMQGWMPGVLVFFPSLVYGWLYARTRDFLLVVLLHALSNLLYVAWIERWLTAVVSGTGA